jgi:serine/threonine protein kinase
MSLESLGGIPNSTLASSASSSKVQEKKRTLFLNALALLDRYKMSLKSLNPHLENPLYDLSPKRKKILASHLGGVKAYNLWWQYLETDLSAAEEKNTLLALLNFYQGQESPALVDLLSSQMNLTRQESIKLSSNSDLQKKLKNYLEMALDPYMIFSFTAASFAYRFTRFKTLKILAAQKPYFLAPGFYVNRGATALNLSRANAFMMENLVFSSLGMARQVYEQGSVSSADIRNIFASNMIVLGSLKGFAHLGHSLHRYLGASHRHIKMTGHLSAILGLSLGHDLQWQWGLRPDRLSLGESLLESAILQSQLSLGAFLVRLASRGSLEKQNKFWENRIYSENSYFALRQYAGPKGFMTPESKFMSSILMMSQNSEEGRSQVLQTDPYNQRTRVSFQKGKLKDLVEQYPDLLERTVAFDLRALLSDQKSILNLLPLGKLVGYSLYQSPLTTAEVLIPGKAGLPDISQGDYLVPPEIFQSSESKLYRHARYRIEGLLGKGAKGVVLRVKDTKFDRDLAAKFILREGDADADSSHQIPKNIQEEAYYSTLSRTLSIHSAFRLGPYDVIIMEEIHGHHLGNLKLQEYLLEHDSDLRLRITIAKQMMAQIHFLSSLGLIHRDLKPDNVMVEGLISGDPQKIRVRIYDMGISEEVRYPHKLVYKLDPRKPLMGAPTYIHPDHVSPDLVFLNWKAIDLYGAGLILYQLFTGQYAYVYRGKYKSEAQTLGLDDLRPLIYRGSIQSEQMALRLKIIEEAVAVCRKNDIDPILPAETINRLQPFGMGGIIYNWLRFQVNDVPKIEDLGVLPEGAKRGVYLDFQKIIRKSMGLDGSNYQNAEEAYRDLDALSKSVEQLPDREIAYAKLKALQEEAMNVLSLLGKEEIELVYEDLDALHLNEIRFAIEILSQVSEKVPDYQLHFNHAENLFDTALRYKERYLEKKESSVKIWEKDPSQGYKLWLEAHEAWSHYLSGLVGAESEYKLALNIFPNSGHARSCLLEASYLRYTDTFDSLLQGERRDLEHTLQVYDISESLYRMTQMSTPVRFNIHAKTAKNSSIEIYRYRESNVGQRKNYRLESNPVVSTTALSFDVGLKRGYYLIRVQNEGHFPLVHRFKYDFNDIEAYHENQSLKVFEYHLASYELFPAWMIDWAKDYFVYVPPLRVEMGIDPKQAMGPVNLMDLRSQTSFEVLTEGSFLARFPLTALEYAEFIQSLLDRGLIEEANRRLPRLNEAWQKQTYYKKNTYPQVLRHGIISEAIVMPIKKKKMGLFVYLAKV